MASEKKCPHHGEPLRLVGEVVRIDGKGNVTTTEKFRCPVEGCGYTFTRSERNE